MWVWICASSRTPEAVRRKHSTAHSRYAGQPLRRSGSPSRMAGSSICTTLTPADSRSHASSRMARAIWRAVSRRGWSSRTNDHWSIVTGPVSMPLTGRLVSDWAYLDQFTVMGFGRWMSPKMMGGLTIRVP